MAAKRTSDHETESTVKKNKRLRKDSIEATMTDRLSNLPESLQLQILSSLDFKEAVQTSVLSKSWVSTWTYIPVLNFSCISFQNLRVFDKFVFKVLSVRQKVRPDKLTFKRGGSCSAKLLKNVFDYAFSQGVKELESQISYVRGGKGWPILSHTSSDSLTSLKLESYCDMSCSLLGPRSGCFKNLTDLNLRRVDISDLDPFSGFPSLQRLKIILCRLTTIGNTLDIHTLQLWELTIAYHAQKINCLELTTPKLRYFHYQGINFPVIKTHKSGLPILDTVIIKYNGLCFQEQEKIEFDELLILFYSFCDELLILFYSFCNAKSLRLFSSIVHLLSLFPDDLANRQSPFSYLKCLNLEFSLFYRQNLFERQSRSLEEALRAVPGVKDYLLPKAHDAKCRVTYPNDLDRERFSQYSIVELPSNFF